MKLDNWEYDIIDLDESYSSDLNLSVLANAVDFLNLDFASNVGPYSNVMEIGCGVQSVFKDNLISSSKWFGIDIFLFDSKGIRTIATSIASVGAIPYSDNYFDFVLSNQSIEHWDEYYVSPVDGLSEIFRILKIGGIAKINFPIHLHGSPVFVKGDFPKIDSFFEDAGFSIVQKVAVIDSSSPNYKGWRKCRFPDFYALSLMSSERTSYVVEYTLKKLSDNKYYLNNYNFKRQNKSSSSSSSSSFRSRSSFFLHLRHGPMYILWKIFRQIYLLLSIFKHS